MPKNEPEYIYCIMVLLTSAIINAIVFGDIAGLVLNLTKDDTRIQDLNDRNNKVMHDLLLQNDL